MISFHSWVELQAVVLHDNQSIAPSRGNRSHAVSR